jgi:uncharacterized membrane protein YgcG
MPRCGECLKQVTSVQQVRECKRCIKAGRAEHAGITPDLSTLLMLSAFDAVFKPTAAITMESADVQETLDRVSGGGGEFGGAGASAGFDVVADSGGSDGGGGAAGE